MRTETIEFAIVLDPQHWSHPPGAEIAINNTVIWDNFVARRTTVRFQHTLQHGQTQSLTIRRYNKVNDQPTALHGMKKDQLLTIQQITIDGVDIQNIIYSRSWYEPDYPEPWAQQQQELGQELLSQVPGETVLGHNGVWHLTFESPFYRWLMDDVWA